MQNCFFVKHTLPKHQFKTRASGSTLGMIYETFSYLAHTHRHTHSAMCGSDTIETLFWVGPSGELMWVEPVVWVTEGRWGGLGSQISARGASSECGPSLQLLHSWPTRRKGKWIQHGPHITPYPPNNVTCSWCCNCSFRHFVEISDIIS